MVYVFGHDLPAGHWEHDVDPSREYYSFSVPEQAIGDSDLVGHL